MNRHPGFGSILIELLYRVNRVLGIQSAQFIRAEGDSVSKNTKIHYQGRFLGMRECDRWEYAYRTNASGVVGIVAVTDTRELILVEQYRIPVKSRVIELPAGLSGDDGDFDEALETAAERELLEETGYSAGSLENLLTCPSSSGMSNEVITMFYAGDLKRTGPGGGSHNEKITVHHVPLDGATEWLEARMGEGMLVDPKVYAALFWAGQRHG